MVEIINTFIFDIPRCSIGQEIVVIGIISDRKVFQDKTLGVTVKDITGKIMCLFESSHPIKIKRSDEIRIHVRVKLTGVVKFNSRNIRVLKDISNLEILGTFDSELSELDSEMREQASRMLMGRICRKVSIFLRAKHFVEFESRLISNRWHEDSLEPLQVIFPGFGTPAFLTTSPAAQVIDFMSTTIVPKAYTISSSFTTSYRFPNGSAETKVIVAKAMNLNLENQEQIILEVSSKILAEFNKTEITSTKLSGVWPEKIDGDSSIENQFSHDLNLIRYIANIPVVGKKWNANIDTIIQLLDKDKNILAEGSREHIGNDVIISSITIYPSQFLGLIEKAPFRQLQNLTKAYD